MQCRWHNIRYDDVWVLIAWLCYTAMAACTHVQSKMLWFTIYVDAGHVAATKEEMVDNVHGILTLVPAVPSLFLALLGTVTASLLALFYRLIAPKPWLRLCCFAVAAVNATSFVVVTTMCIVACYNRLTLLFNTVQFTTRTSFESG